MDVKINLISEDEVLHGQEEAFNLPTTFMPNGVVTLSENAPEEDENLIALN